MALTFHLAQALIEAAHDRAAALGAHVSVAVVDLGGHLVALGRMDGAPPLSAQIAEAKAASIVLVGRDGAALRQMQDAWPTFFAQVEKVASRPLLAGAGSLLIRSAGIISGGIAVSGGQPDQDDACAEAGITAFTAGQHSLSGASAPN